MPSTDSSTLRTGGPMAVTHSTAGSAPGSRRPALRCLPVPPTEPPFDDEHDPSSTPFPGVRAAPTAASRGLVQGTLAFELPRTDVMTRASRPERDLRLVPPAEEMDGVRIVSDRGLPDARPWATQLTQGVLEVLSGDRPVTQLLRWTSQDVYDTLQRRMVVGARAHGQARVRRRAAVRSVHVTRPDVGVAEVAATALREGRLQAIALRLEGINGRWQCTALELG